MQSGMAAKNRNFFGCASGSRYCSCYFQEQNPKKKKTKKNSLNVLILVLYLLKSFYCNEGKANVLLMSHLDFFQFQLQPPHIVFCASQHSQLLSLDGLISFM